mgnify:CR=1 FL=1
MNANAGADDTVLRILLVHLSDLFYPSGTAIIYRRLIDLIGDRAEVHHHAGKIGLDQEPMLHHLCVIIPHPSKK